MEHKMAYLVVLCSAFLHISLAGSELAIYHDIINSGIVMILSCKAVSYLLYPLLGWLADVCFYQIQVHLACFHYDDSRKCPNGCYSYYFKDFHLFLSTEWLYTHLVVWLLSSVFLE